MLQFRWGVLSTFLLLMALAQSVAARVTRAPGIPTNLSIPSSSTSDTFTMTWTPGSGMNLVGGPAFYQLDQSTNGGSTYSAISAPGRTASSLSLTVTSGTYKYRLRACKIDPNTEALKCSGYAYSGSIVVTLNTAPTITNMTNRSVQEDKSTGNIAFTIGDAQSSASSLTLSKATSNSTLVPAGNIVFGGSGANRTVMVTPAANKSGSATITVTVSDGSLTKSDTFVLTVNAVNDKPTITNISNKTINEDNNTGNIAFTIGDVETSTSSLTLSKATSNSTLVPSSNITFGGSAANRTVKVTPAANESGTATITVTVSDGSLTNSDTFVVTVNAINDKPTITNISNKTINEDSNTGNIAFTIGDVETSTSSLTLSKATSNSTLVPSGNITFGGSAANRTVKVTPAANESGTATITVTVSDGSLTKSDSFVVTVNAVNDKPVISQGSSVSIVGDQAKPIVFSLSATDSESNTLTWSLSSSASDGTVTGFGTGNSRSLTYTSDNDFNGSDSFIVEVSDGSLSDTITIDVTVNYVEVAEPDWAKKSSDTVLDATEVTPIISTQQAVGALDGNGGISGGAATYSIPVAIPPGRNGVQPNISINYSSRSGNGIAGSGWSLTGGSSVHRCSQIYDVDGNTLSVLLQATDKLCLDGERLILLSGSYGQGGATYSPESNPFVRVTQSGDMQSNTSSFTAEFADGSHAIYGGANFANQLVYGVGKTITWAIHKKTDATGSNVIDYHYDNFGNGEYWMSHIYYTGDSASEGDREVEFIYDDRELNRNRIYIAGGHTNFTKKLAEINTYYQSTLVRQYQLTQSANTTTQLTQLDGVTECAYLNGIESCLPETSFTYFPEIGEMLVNTDSQIFGGLNGQYGSDNVAGFDSFATLTQEKDFDGDGSPDTSRDGKVYFSSMPENQTGIAIETLSSSIHAGRFNDAFIDHNMDGRADRIYVDSNNEITITEYTFDESSGAIASNTVNTGIDATCPIGRDPVGTYVFCYGFTSDIDGDGRVDLLVPYREGQEAWIAGDEEYWTSDGIVQYSYYRRCDEGTNAGYCLVNDNVLQINESSNQLQLMDINGDGKIDIVHLYSSSDVIEWYQQSQSTPGDFTLHTHSIDVDRSYRNGKQHWLDVNADGLTDLLILSKESTDRYSWVAFINYGNGTFSAKIDTGLEETTWGNNLNGLTETWRSLAGYIKTVDWDGDGVVDLLSPSLLKNKVRCNFADQAKYDVCQPDSVAFMTPNALDVYTWKVHLTRSDGQTVYFETVDLPDLEMTLGTNKLIDINGDGIKDLVSGVGYDGAILKSSNQIDHGLYVYQRDYNKQGKMQQIINGLGSSIKFDYLPLNATQRTQDLQSTEGDYPYFNFNNTMQLAYKVEHSNGIGGFNETEYHYGNARYHVAGRGFQGFENITTVDKASDIKSITEFHNKFPLSGKVKRTASYINGEDEQSVSALSETISTFDYRTDLTQTQGSQNEIYFVYNSTNQKINRDLNNRTTVLSDITNHLNSQDDYGNTLTTSSIVVKGNTSSSGTVQTTTVNEYYSANISNWWLSKLKNTSVTSESSTGTGAVYQASLDPKKEIKTSYTYTANRQPDVVTVEPILGGGFTTSVDTDYNAYGLPTTMTTSSQGESRSVTTTYSNDGETESTDGYFVYKVTNDLDHSVTTKTYPEHGQVKEVIDANGLSSNTEYDAFGRIEKVTPPLGTGQPAYSRFADCLGGCDDVTSISPTSTALNDLAVSDVASLIAYKVTTTAAGSPETTLYKDKFNRVIVAKTQGFDGSPIFVRTEYDSLGRKVFESVPSFVVDEDKGTHWVRFDEQGRLLEKKLDEPTRLGTAQWFTTTYSYNDHQTSIDAVGTTKTLPTMYRTYNGIGQLMKTTDAKGGVTEYAYDAQGNPIVLQDANGNPITAEYNALGQKKYVIDPNMGRKDFTYKPFGEIDTETDARSIVTEYDYDILGRLETRTAGGVLEASFVYDLASKGGSTDTCVGAIQSETRNDSGADNFNKVYSYDDYCRPSSVTTNIGSESYTQATQYDSFYGRVKGSQTVTGITLETQYNDYGYATKSLNAASGYVYQEVTDMDARLNLTAALKANGILNEVLAYTHETGQMESVHTDTNVGGTQRHRIDYEYDDFGNLALQEVENIRNGNVIASSESYDYDDLHRLTNSSQDIDGVVSNIGYVYDAVGNIKSKGDFGNGFVYGDMSRATDNAGPNAVVSVNKNTGGTATYEYDLNGNMTNGDGKTLTYNAFNKPLTITKGGITSTFSYAADQMRYKQVKTGSGADETTIYIDKAYEEITQDGVTKKRSYLGDAIVTETIGGTDAGFKIGFVHRDRLGSTVTITNENGDVVDNKSFDPFGKPREGTFERVDSDTIVVPATLDFIRQLNNYEEHTDRGFTDHEHLDDSELIHMNGRVYDYNLGRFLSVDPFIGDPGNSQSLNPYSYIMNNPLAGTDPSGYIAEFPSCGGRRGGSLCDDYAGVSAKCFATCVSTDNGGGNSEGQKKSESKSPESIDLRDDQELGSNTKAVGHERNKSFFEGKKVTGSTNRYSNSVGGFVNAVVDAFSEYGTEIITGDVPGAGPGGLKGATEDPLLGGLADFYGAGEAANTITNVSNGNVSGALQSGAMIFAGKVKAVKKAAAKIEEQVTALRQGIDVRVNSVEEAREILNNMPELRPGPGGNVMPGLRDRKNTYRGDLINTQDPLSPNIHPRGKHKNQPHYNIELIDKDGKRQKPAIFIDTQ